MNEIKYYTPEISEFHVGLEYEYRFFIYEGCKRMIGGVFYNNEWSPWYKCDNPILVSYDGLSEDSPFYWNMHGNSLDNKSYQFRVKYLDESDVKCFAKKNGRYWYEIVVEEDDCKYVYNIRFVEDLFREDVGHKIFISLDETSNGVTTKDIVLFNGCVKNKSEFEVILKSVNIIDR